MSISARVDDREVLKLFQNLPRTTKARILRPAVLAGAALIRDRARANVAAVSDPFTGLLQRRGTIVAVQGKTLRKGQVTARVQIRRGLVNPAKKGEDGGPVRVGLYAAILEYGSAALNREGHAPFRRAGRDGTQDVLKVVRTKISSNLTIAIAEAKR